MKHTPVPWKACLNVPFAVIPGHLIKTDDDVERPIASLWEGGGTKGKPTQIANAKFIVRACNSYDDLLEACKKSLDWLSQFAEHAPIEFGGEAELGHRLQDVIAKAEPPNDKENQILPG